MTMSQAELAEQLDELARQYGNRFLLEAAPDNRLPEHGMRAVDAMRLIGEELVLDGIPMRNLATFVTTWMEPEAQRIIAENLHRNFIDHAEYPQTAEIEQRCIRILADLFNAPGETTGARTQGSSEAIMLGALSLKWKWRERREQAGKSTDRPNLVFGGDVHVVWEKFCRYFDVEPRIIPLQEDKYTIGPEDVEPHVDENTIGVAAVLGTTFTGHADDIVGVNDLLLRLKSERGLDVPLHVDGASGGFVWPFLYPHSEWDFRLEQVRSINASGHKFGLVYPGIGWLIFRERSDLPEDLVFYENYLGKTDATFTLNFSTGSAMVLAQYYNSRPLRSRRLPLHHGDDAGEHPPAGGASGRHGRLPADRRRERGAAPARRLPAGGRARLRRVRRGVAAGRGAWVDGARLHAAAQRGPREDHAGARKADPRPLTRLNAGRRHRRGVRDAQEEGRASLARPEASQDRNGVLT
jgi:glutamate decarboxylase